MEPTETRIHGGGSNPLDSTGLCLLSLDGGGVRGLSTLYILKGLMDRLNWKRTADSPARKPCDIFDLIGGTGTGGIIAIMLGRLEMDVDECIEAYVQMMRKVFQKPSQRIPRSLSGNIEPQFDADNLQDAINEVISNRGTSPTDLFNDKERGCRVFVCSIAQETKDIVRLRSYKRSDKSDSPATISQAARATSATTTFFGPVSIGARRYADGALGANNPVYEVEGEASDIWCPESGELKPLVKCFISIGAGNPGKKPIEDNLAKFYSETLSALTSETENTERRFIANWRQHFDSGRYFRFNVDQGLQDVGLAEYQQQGMIDAATDGYLSHQAVTFQVRNCIQNLETKQSATHCHFAKEIQEWALFIQRRGHTRWHVPFEKNKKFTGRKELLDNLKQRLELSPHSTEKIAIIGLGGVGKTQLVLQLAYKVREHCAVFWIPVNTWANLQAHYQELAQSLHLPGCEKSGTHILESVQRYLSDESIGPWLLVMDNADELDLWTAPISSDSRPKRLIDYMPRSKHGTIIWTTRDRTVATTVAQENVVTVPELDELGASEMMRGYLINKHLTTASEHALPGLLQKLTYLPLAIVQAASYINKTGISLMEYESLFSSQDEEAIELLSKAFEDDSRYKDVENAVTKTWLISFEQICRSSDLALEYLTLMACVDPKDIPKSLLPPSEPPSRIKQNDAIGILDAFSFITRHEDGLRYDMHRLVHLATREWLNRREGLASCHTKAARRLNELLSDISRTNRTVWQVYISHAQYAVTGKTSSNEEVVNLAQRCGDCLQYDGRYHEAGIMYKKVLAHRETVLGSEHPNTLNSVNNLGSVLYRQGQHKEAESMYQQALKIRERVLGPEHPDTLRIFNNLGSVLDIQGQYEKAEAMHRRALKVREKAFGHENFYTLSSVNNLGSALYNQDRYDEAETLYQRALRAGEKVLGPEHPSTLEIFNNLGSAIYHQGRYDEAEAMHQKALRDREKALGPEHPSTLDSVNNLGLVLQIQGQYEKAEAMHRRASRDREKVLGPEHPDTLNSVNNLGSAIYHQGRYDEAEAMHRKALRDREKALGPEHPDTLDSVSNLGSVLQIQGQYEKAEAMHRRASRDREKVLGPEHPDTINSFQKLASVLSMQGK